ncbi:MAG: hypothetical protein WC421_07850 [Elusimicrobiales bacterium]
MKLSAKWFVWFGLVGIYVMVLGGVFYYNLFKWTFDEKLKNDVIEMARLKTADLTAGLIRSPRVITLDEYDVMNWFRNDNRIAEIIYISGAGSIRWHKHAKYIGMMLDDYEKEIGLATNAVSQAYYSGNPKVYLVRGQPFYEIAIPLRARENVIIGVLDLLVSREGSERIISSAMRKYIVGAAGVLLLLGIPLYLFLSHYVITPLSVLRDSIDNISTKSFEIKFARRRDEIGELAESVALFLDKVRVELSDITERDRQRHAHEQAWWQAVLTTAVKRGSRAIVVDEDNNVLYANFEMSAVPGQKLHLLDVVDSQQQDVLKLIGMAMETTQTSVEGDTTFKGEPAHVRAVQVQSEGTLKRTLIIFEPLSK